MSTTVDNRVVEMQFNNKEFESNVSTTLSSLDKLNNSLKLEGATKGLEGINTATKRVDMSPLSGAVETVGLKFNAMYTIADQALRNITNSAMNAGKKIVSALTIDPIKTGFSEYETKINAIQTIMSNTASKGTTMEDVTRVIGELNTYADKTIYNFAEMTRNIGTFTAAGVGLEESAAAIQGIANLAAASGSTSQQASTAMYQLSQALSSGTVKLMDWNSVVNAGMGGQKFQDALKATAREQGIAVDDMIKKHGSFRESLTEGWISADILNSTLQKFTVEGAKEYAKSMVDSGKYTQAQADALIKEAQSMEDAATKVKTFTQLWDTLKESAQSGWSQSWEIIVGNFEEAKEFFTEISGTIGGLLEESANARNEMLENWKVLGGRTVLIDALRNAFEGVMSIVKPVSEAFREIFPPLTSKKLYAFTVGLRDLMAKLKLSETTSDNLKRTFKGLFAIIDIVRLAFVAVFKAIKPLFGGISDLGGGLLDATARFGDWLVALRHTIKYGQIFDKVLGGIAKVIGTVVNGAKKLISFIGTKIVFPGFKALGSLLGNIGKGMSSVSDTAGRMKDGVVSAVDNIGSAFQKSSAFQFLTKVGSFMSTILKGIINIAKSLGSAFMKLASNGNSGGILDFINALINGGIGLALIGFIKTVKDVVESIKGIENPVKGIGGIIKSVGGILDSVRGCFEAYQTQLKAGALMKIAGAIAILTVSLVILSLIDSDKLSMAIQTISVLFAELLAAMGIFTKISGKFSGVFKACTAMISISVAILILSAALKNIADLKPEEMARGLIGVAGLMAIVVVAMKQLSKSGETIIKGASQMIFLALAIKILASVCKDLAGLSWSEMARGLAGVGVLLAEVALFLRTAKFSSKAISTATGMVIMAAAIKILASACGDFGQLSWSEIGKGLVAIGVLLTEVALFTKLTGNAKHVMSTGVALIAISAAMKILASAVSDMSAMSWEGLAKGLVGMAGALAAITIAVNLIPKNMVGIGVGLIAVSAALLILSSALGSMGGMSWEGIGKGLLVLGASLVILVAALHLMNGTLAGSAALVIATLALAMLAPVLMLLGTMSWESIAKGLVAIAGALAIIGVAGLVLAPIVPSILALAGSLALIGVAALAVGAGLLLAGMGVTALSVGFTALCTAVSSGATILVAGLTTVITGLIALSPAIAAAIGEGIVAIAVVLGESGPVILEAFTSILLALIKAVDECIPPLLACVGKLMRELLSFFVECVPMLIEKGCDIIVGFLKGIAKKAPDIIDAAVDLIGQFLIGIGKSVPKVVDAAFKMIVEFINGLANSIRSNTPLLINAVNNLMSAMIDAAKAWIKNCVSIGGNLISGFIEGVKSAGTKLVDSVKGVVSGALEGAKKLLGIKSPSREFAKIGMYSDEGMIVGLEKYAGKVANAAGEVGGGALSAMGKAIAGASDVINDNIDAQPTIRPVLDLSDVESGAGTIGSLFGTNPSVGVLANVGAVGAMMSRRNQNGANDDVVSAIGKLRKDIATMERSSYNFGDITYDDGSNVASAVESLIRAVKVERRR